MKGVKKQIQKELSVENVELIAQYDMEMVRQSIAIATRQKHLRTLLGLSRLLRKNWKSIGKNDIEKLVYDIMQNYSDSSGKETNYSYDHKKVLKIFFRWIKLGSREFIEVGDPPETARVRMKKVRDKIIREDLLTEDDISRLLFACGENTRDRAFIDCHYEGGTRPGEILSLQIKHVKFDKYGATLHVDGKTGPRTVRLVKSTPNLANWLSTHPFKDDPDAFVWINLLKNHYGEQLNYPAARAMVNRRARIAHLEKRVNLNMFRHSEATNSAKFMTEAQLRKRHGWSPESKMPAKYVHMINADVDAAIFEHLGIKIQKKEEKNVPKICQICEMPNSPDSTMCSKCGKPLSLETAIEKEEQEENNRKRLEEEIKNLKNRQVKLENSQKEYEAIKPDLDKMLLEYVEDLGEDFFKQVFGKKTFKN
ncbi:MAG: tyrosine-type recombinase/integrase [Thaumarchaeota archaeon]|nr:tyrosine-type recombinase/integrase [Nitrososphaerota archaeon]